MKKLYLSHSLNSQTPSYGNHGQFTILQKSSISEGGTCNETGLEFNTHIGTHIDAPYHFDNSGDTLDLLPPEHWFSLFPHLINLSPSPKGTIEFKDLESQLISIPINTDFLIIKTGFGSYRNDSSIYCFQNPVLDPDIPIWLRKNRNLKFIGLDLISFGSKSNREKGRATHSNFLKTREDLGPPILLVEDMKLDELSESPKEVFIFPLRFEKSDGAPCTIIANMK